MVSWSVSSSGALSDFHSRPGEGDVLARVADDLHDRLQLLVGERDERQPERARVEANGVEHRLDRHRVGGGRHQRLDHRKQAVVDVLRDLIVAATVSVDQLPLRAAGDVRYEADDAVTADGEYVQSSAVVYDRHLETVV